MSSVLQPHRGRRATACASRSRLLVACAALSVLLGLAGRASAATCTWTGAGADTSVGTAANWAGNQLPLPGDDLVFPAGVAQTTVTNVAAFAFNSMTFATTGGAIYHVSGTITIIDHIQVDSGEADLTGPLMLYDPGNPVNITLSAAAGSELQVLGTVSASASGSFTLHTNGAGRVTLAGFGNFIAAVFVEAGTLRLEHAGALGVAGAFTSPIFPGATLELNVPNGVIANSLQLGAGGRVLASDNATLSGFIDLLDDCTFDVAATKTLTVTGSIHNAGFFVKVGAGEMKLAGTQDNAFGIVGRFPAVVNAGVLRLAQGTPTVDHVALPEGVTIGGGGTVVYQRNDQIEGFVTIASGGQLLLQDKSDTIQWLGGPAGALVVLNTGSLSLSSASFAGSITGTGALNVVNGGTVFLNGPNTFTGTTTVTDTSTLYVKGTLPGPVVLQGGILGGNGTVGPVQGTSGEINPGIQGGGVLHTQSVTLTGGLFTVNGFQLPGGPAWGQLAVTGTVTLGGTSLNPQFDSAITAVPVTPIVIIDNDGADPVVGTFSGLPEGASFVTNGLKYYISYHGGDGNDVVLSATPVPQTLKYYLSEGSTGGFFTTDVLIANPNSTDAPITIAFYTQNNGVVSKDLVVPAMQRQTITLNSLPELGDGAVSTIVTSNSNLPLIVERTMTWDKSGYGAHGDKAVGGPAATWYFAEGSQGFFSTYVLLANPQTTANNAHVTYYREGDVPITRTYALTPQSRTTIDLGADAALVNRSFGMQVQFDLPGVAERSMYFGTSPFWSGGHESAGVTQPSTDWLLAEGATGPFFETFILLANPNATDAQATVTFLPSGGTPVIKTKTVPANSRLTINIEPEDPALANAAVATQIHATVPLIAERSQYWPDPAPQWYEAHNSFGVTAPGVKWGLAEGRVGQTPTYQTYILLANPGTTTANVTIQFLREHGGATITKTFAVPATSRRNVSVGGPGSDVPELVDENFGAIITADQPIAVERSMYSNAIGQIWAAGTNATASPLP